MKIKLNDRWMMTYRDLSWTRDKVLDVLAATDYIDAGNLPSDAHMPLIRDGIIKDPVVADHCFDCEWMETKSWWYRREFFLSEEHLGADELRLTLESLDTHADIFINGRHIGSHDNCHRPFIATLNPLVHEGENSLLIRLTSGTELWSDQEIQYLAPYVSVEGERNIKRGDKRRAFLRQPDYVYGWDWGPRIATVGIMKNAWIEVLNRFTVTSIHPITRSVSDPAKLRVEVEFESLMPITTCEVDVLLQIMDGDTVVFEREKNVLALSGRNYVDFDAEIIDPKLWWPNGAGEQPLYTARATLRSEQYTATSSVPFGIRTVELNLEKCGENDRRFAIRVNGVDIYAKGADWIPADSIYARVDRNKYETLLSDARDCHFNMLRMWGGGNYERDEFYQLCDRYGLLIWQDFMFGCALYPDDQEWFRDEVRKELEYQVRRLRHHPAMALWCGNNENQWIYENTLSSKKRFEFSGGLTVYNQIAPAAVREHSPEIPYWPSSPYGGNEPNGDDAGDCHFWNPATMNPDMNRRITPETYDTVRAKFVSEYGYIGPCSEATIEKYFGEYPIEHNGSIWNLHNNTFEKATVPEGIRRHYVDPETLKWREYLEYARLVQGLMYQYSLEAIRYYPRNDGSLFWMYNDTWGEVGWTIVDYYLDRKPSYYYVKRAFSPIKMILRYSESKSEVRIMGVNDTAEAVTLSIEFGWCGFDRQFETQTTTITLPAFSKSIAHEFPVPAKNLQKGVIFARGENMPISFLRTGNFRDYELQKTTVQVTHATWECDDLIVTVRSDGYAHAVNLGLPAAARMDDNYFDMLPGDTRTVTVYGAKGQYRLEDVLLTFVGLAVR